MKTKSYDPSMDMIMECLSSGNKETQEKIELYIIHRKRFGRIAAKNKFPEVHYIQIIDPVLRDVWTTLLKTVDTL